MKVLLVEDEASLADVLARNLRARGHAVTIAGSAEEAVLGIRSWHPQAVILDINLPDDSGWEVYRRLNPSEREGLHVVVISAGEAVVNPPGVWHTADSGDGGWVLTITPGLETEHRPR